ncbi:MAG: hypothetical protein WC712_11855 [Candidatus Brocadiia bacterium]
MKILPLVLIAVMLFCGCSWSVKPGQSSSNSEIEILVSAVPAIGKANDPDSDGYASIGGKTLTWEELEQYFHSRAENAACPPYPDDGFETQVVIRTGPDTPMWMVYLTSLVAYDSAFRNTFFGLTGEKQRFRAIFPIYRGMPESPTEEPSDFTDDSPSDGSGYELLNTKIFVSVFCMMSEGKPLWRIDDQPVYAAGDIAGRLKGIVAATKKGEAIVVSLGSQYDAPFRLLFAVLEATSEAGIAIVVIEPVRIPLSFFR